MRLARTGGTNTDSFKESMNEYRRQLQKGDIKRAYRGLMDYIMELRSYFEKKYPGYFVSGSVYYGYMDMTYFSFVPKSLKLRKLKVAVVFVHDRFRFEVWLAGLNKQAQTKYWSMFKEANLDKYSVPSTTKGADSIIEGVLVEDPDFSDLRVLTKQIESGTLRFIEYVEGFLDNH